MIEMFPRSLKFRMLSAVALLIAILAVVVAQPPRVGYASHCSFTNRTPAPASVVFDTTPIIAVNFTCLQPITNVTMTLDGAVQTPHVAGPSQTQQSTFFEPPSPLASGIHVVRITVTAGGTTEFVEWSFTIPSLSPCGTASASGGSYPASGLAFVVWIGATPCPASAAATNIGLGSGETISVLWYLDHATNVWRYYLPSTASGTLSSVPTVASLAAIFS